MHSIFRRTSRVLVAAAGLTALSALVAAPAFGQYGGTTGALTIPTTVSAGEVVSLSFSGCAANTAVTVSFDSSRLGSLTSDSAGAVSRTITIPSSASAGSHTVTATCANPAGATLTVTQTVTVAAATASSALPFTGANAVPVALIALGLCLMGGAATLVSRRRRSSTV